MEIRFCDRCSESIPDSDFDSGRAVTVDGRHLHVNCALSRSLSLNGPRSWLTLMLALYAAGVATFLLVSVLGKTEEPRVSAAVVAHVQGEDAALLAKVKKERDGALAILEQEVARLGADQAKGLKEQVEQATEVLGSRITETDRLSHDRVTALTAKVKDVEDEIGRLSAMIREALERAAHEATRQPAPVAQPPTPEPAPEPDPGPTSEPADPQPPRPTPPPRRDPEHDAEVDRWIQRLRDSNENIRFSATLELGRLKDLRAAGPLIEVLKSDRDYYVRLGAATALGDMKACAAVPALVEALDDKDTLVRTAANDALQAVTGHSFDFVTEMSGRERRKVMKQWRDWWKANESGVRGRLGQLEAAGGN